MARVIRHIRMMANPQDGRIIALLFAPPNTHRINKFSMPLEVFGPDRTSIHVSSRDTRSTEKAEISKMTAFSSRLCHS